MPSFSRRGNTSGSAQRVFALDRGDRLDDGGAADGGSYGFERPKWGTCRTRSGPSRRDAVLIERINLARAEPSRHRVRCTLDVFRLAAEPAVFARRSATRWA